MSSDYQTHFLGGPPLPHSKYNVADSHYLENHTTSYFCSRWSDLDEIKQPDAEQYPDYGDMVKIETESRIPIWRTFVFQCAVV